MGVQFREIIGWARRRKVFASLLVIVTLGVGILIGTVISGHALATRDQTAPSGAALLAIPDPVTLSNGFAGISKRLEPAVVNISTTQVLEKSKSGNRRHLQNDPFGDFFDRFFDSPDDSDNAERSLGSGVIVDKKGFILTNDHVIDQATKIQVQLDGDPVHYTAKVIGTDKDTDLAIIKIDSPHELSVAKLGNSDGVQVGDWVLAFGSPFGLNSTVTAGIVSAKDRANLGGPDHQFQRFIQTDAAINPGNSGGPLVNLAGEVIGINTAIYTGSRGFEGVGFALPSNVAIGVYNQLITTGRVVRGSIGVTFQEDNSANPVLMKELGAPYGIVVEDVAPGSPADKAGLKPGDVITHVNGQAVHSGSDLVNPVAQTPLGQSVHISYVRDKQEKEVTVLVADRSKLFPQIAQNADDQQQEGAETSQVGAHVEELTPDLARKLGMPKVTGVIVTDVEPASFAEDLGFARGDVITEVNRVPVTSLADYRREVSKLKPGQDVLIKVERRSGNDNERMLTTFLAGTVPANSAQ
ncbi:MAG TPA: trypsin-like peptidase domain-containing protein [Candidatus Cybelea sp.]|nr:trypsin-like peptidase domain-containing protein [Candidatus Cybelea sp.]